MTALVTEASFEAFVAGTPLLEVDAPAIAAFVGDGLRGLHERLAFSIRPDHGEIDYFRNHAEPHPRIAQTLIENDDAIAIYRNGLPCALD